MTELGMLKGSIGSRAYDINNSGVVVGSSGLINGGSRDTLWNGTTVTDLDMPPGFSSSAHAINNNGVVVGESYGSVFGAHATLWDGASVIDLNSVLDASVLSVGWVLTSARGINDNGWIIGTAYNAKSNMLSPFLLKPAPVPVPAALWLFGTGCLGLIGVARRKGH